MSKIQQIRTFINLPAPLHEYVRNLADKDGITISEVIRRIISERKDEKK